jgi:hypothetical protein
VSSTVSVGDRPYRLSFTTDAALRIPRYPGDSWLPIA